MIYKDGTVEVLQRTSSTSPYRIVALQFENGERMKWEYAAGGSLERILDHDQQVLLLLTYSSGRLVRADTRVDGGVMRVSSSARPTEGSPVSAHLMTVVNCRRAWAMYWSMDAPFATA